MPWQPRAPLASPVPGRWAGRPALSTLKPIRRLSSGPVDKAGCVFVGANECTLLLLSPAFWGPPLLLQEPWADSWDAVAGQPLLLERRINAVRLIMPFPATHAGRSGLGTSAEGGRAGTGAPGLLQGSGCRVPTGPLLASTPAFGCWAPSVPPSQSLWHLCCPVGSLARGPVRPQRPHCAHPGANRKPGRKCWPQRRSPWAAWPRSMYVEDSGCLLPRPGMARETHPGLGCF